MPTREAILVATGTDRPGVLDDVSLFLYEQQAKILESRVSLLRGAFGLLLLIRAEDEAMKRIESSMPELEQRAGIHAEMRTASDERPHDSTPLRLIASGNDPADVVHRLSHLMRVLNVNIENINTEGDKADGFKIEMDLSVPRATPVMMLKQYVQSLAGEMNVRCDVNAL